MKSFHRSRQWLLFGMACGLVLGCAPKPTLVGIPLSAVDATWTKRTISNQELEAWAEKDPDLSPRVSMEILARLNGKGRLYIQEDIQRQRVLKVPNDFRAYLTWTPLPRHIALVGGQPKFILAVKDIPFLGWYERGSLIGDTHICVGKRPEWTKAGLYRIREKDADHVSASYRNAYGSPALMPFAMRIYERVWIHGGDITGGYCSHGCINLPLDAAAKLFQWTDRDTLVLIVASLEDLQQALAKHSALLGRSARIEDGAPGKPENATGDFLPETPPARESPADLHSSVPTQPPRER